MAHYSVDEPRPLSDADRERIKRRRWHSRSDDEILDTIDSRLPYRQGWPRLPPLPVNESYKGLWRLDNQADFITKIQSLCIDHGIDPHRIYFAFRCPQVQEPGEDYHTLVVAVDFPEDYSPRVLILAICKCLSTDPKTVKTILEVIDTRVLHSLARFPVPSSKTEILNAWQPAFNIALESIGREQWLTIELLFRGVHRDITKCKPTIVITSPTAANTIWDTTILPDINLKLSLSFPSLGLQTELLCASSIQINSDPESESQSGVCPTIRTYSDIVTMGSSIGQDNLKNHSATAGGMVKLSDGSMFALTNYHVVRNQNLDDILLSLSSGAGEQAFLKPQDDNRKYRFTCPSNEDHHAYIQTTTCTIEQWSIQTYLSDAEKYSTIAQAELEKAKNKDRFLGTVHASSGIRKIKCEKFSTNTADGQLLVATSKPQYQFILDWSLLNFDSGRRMINFLPMDRPRNRSKGLQIKPGESCAKWTVLNSPAIKAEIDTTIGKCGRSTDFTYGNLSEVPVIINPKTRGGMFRSMSETYQLTVEDCGLAWAFYDPNHDVVEPGDSGSIVMHAPSGYWVGLLFGQSPTLGALFTPIDVIFRDIEKVTGLKVVEPVFESLT